MTELDGNSPSAAAGETVILAGGRVIDPSSATDDVMDLVIKDGRIAEAGRGLAPSSPPAAGTTVIDVEGLIVCPGLVDIHVHLRTPGQEDKEDLTSGTAAAAAGGFTAVCCMPNTDPPLDNPRLLEELNRRLKSEGCVRVYPVAAVTLGLEGTRLAPLAELHGAGAAAFTDDGLPVWDDGLMEAAMEAARDLGVPIAQHAEVPELAKGGAVHPGEPASQLNLPVIPPEAEADMVERDCRLAEKTGGSVHVLHVSAAETVEVIRRWKSRGVAVTAEVTPHHLALTDQVLLDFDGHPVTKVNPPLRGEEDRRALIAALLDGTIDCIATDHAPHREQDKQLPYESAAFGISGLETALSLSVEILVEGEGFSWLRLLGLMSTVPARLFGLEGGTLAKGVPADVTVIDPAARWTVDPDKFFSKGRNTPLAGRAVPARAVLTFVGGRLVYDGLGAEGPRVRMPGGRWLGGQAL